MARETSFQMLLGESISLREASSASELKIVCRVREGAMVYPERGRRGLATEPFEVKRLDRDQKVKGYAAWWTLESTELFLDGERWTLWAGSRVGVPAKQISKTKK